MKGNFTGEILYDELLTPLYLAAHWIALSSQEAAPS